MNILIVHNLYRTHGGEEGVVDMQCRLFRDHGHSVFTYFRDYKEISTWKFGKYRSLFTSIYNSKAAKEVDKLVKENKIEVALIHNLYPIISPSVLKVLKKNGVRTIWVAHNFRLICPIGLLYNKGKICEKCKCGVRELHAITNRCEGTMLGSTAYAMRSMWARISGMIKRNIDCYVSLTEFQRRMFISHGLDGSKIKVIGNTTTFPPLLTDGERDGSVLYAGRISVEKGTNIFFEAARLLPDIRFVVAGDGDILPEWGEVPANVELLGRVERRELIELYKRSSMLAITSTCFEAFPLTPIEASLSLCPVIYPYLGAFIDRIKEGETGLFFRSPEELANQITRLHQDKELAQRIAVNSQVYSLKEYNTGRYIEQFEEVFLSLDK